MNLQELQSIYSQIEQSMVIDYIFRDSLIVLSYHEDYLYISWTILKNTLTSKIACRGTNNRIQSLSVGISFDELDGLLWDMRDCPNTAELSATISPTEMQINAEEFDFSFSFIDVVSVEEIYESPQYWNIQEECHILTSFDSNQIDTFLAASYVTSSLSIFDKQVMKFPQLRGVNLNCFSDIIEIVSMNMVTIMYRYIHGSKRVSKPKSFTVSPDVFFLIMEVMSESAAKIQIHLNSEYIIFEIGESTSIAAPIIRGIFTYSRIPINNVGSNRLSINREKLLTALNLAVIKKDIDLEEPDFSITRICEKIKINIQNDGGSFEENDGNILCSFNVCSSSSKLLTSIWVDGYNLIHVLQKIPDEEISFLVPEHHDQALIIEGDKTQYILLPLCNGDEDSHVLLIDQIVHLEPERKVIFSSPPLTPGEPTMQISMSEVPMQQHDFSDFLVEPREYNFWEECEHISAQEDYDLIQTSTDKLIDELNLIVSDRLPDGVNGDDVKVIINKLEEDLDFLLTKSEFGLDTVKKCNVLMQQGILLRSRLLQGHLKIKPTYQMEMSFH